MRDKSVDLVEPVLQDKSVDVVVESSHPSLIQFETPNPNQAIVTETPTIQQQAQQQAPANVKDKSIDFKTRLKMAREEMLRNQAES